MAVDKATVASIAKLAHIRVADARREALADELSNILGWIEQLSELDTSAVEPMTSVVAMRPPLRADAVSDGDRRDDVLRNAPEAMHGYFVVPKVVE